uniref:ATP-dependent DNA helicase n=1 Tax=Cacopsylla melanoneura TaxID=428564 RepID=A0A8D8VRR9_9HEMI
MEHQFDCVASGSFHQGDKNLFPTTYNKQCVANATSALGLNFAEIPFNRSTIDETLRTGDKLYQTVQARRAERRLAKEVFLDPEELTSVTEGLDRQIVIMDKRVEIVRVDWCHQGLWPSSPSELEETCAQLAVALQDEVFTDEGIAANGFLFTGLHSTVSFWRTDDQFFLFDSHAVNERRVYDHHPENNRARLFSCSTFMGLGSLLLNRLADGPRHEYSIHRVHLEMVTSHLEDQERMYLPRTPEPAVEPMSVSPLLQPDILNSTTSKKTGRPKKVRRGRKPVVKEHSTSVRKTERSTVDQLEEDMSSVTIGSIVQNGSPRQPQLEEMMPFSPRQDPKLRTACVVVSPLNMDLGSPVESRTSRKGRHKKVKRGRPKTLESTQEEQLAAAKRKYASSHSDAISQSKRRYVLEHPDVNRKAAKKYNKKHPDVHRRAVKTYNLEHPDVHRESVRIYTQEHPNVNREAVRNYSQLHPDVSRESTQRFDEQHPEEHLERNRRFRVNNPSIDQMRHLQASTRRLIREEGPMAYWDGSTVSNIEAYRLGRSNLHEENVYRCVHCGARLFEEERGRKKWCCGEGLYNVLDLSSLEAPFYQNQQFLQRARAYNDLFAFSARILQGTNLTPQTGVAFYKIDGRMHYQIHHLNAPGRSVWLGPSRQAKLVNQSRLYLDDGEERRELALGRGLDEDLVNEITEFVTETNPYVSQLKVLGQAESIHARLEFELTTRSTHGARLGDRNTGIEVHAVLSTEEAVCAPSQLAIWREGSDRPSTVGLFSPLMEPFQYPLLYPQGTPGWCIERLNNQGRKMSQLSYYKCLLLSEPRFSSLGRLSQAWQVEMFARYEEEQLNFIRGAQEKSNNTGVRIGPLDELLNAREQGILRDVAQDETVRGEGGAQPGKVYLPCSFTGGPRYMKVHYENAIGLVSRLGAPTFFLTFTYSAQWVEHKASVASHGWIDPPTCCRIFQIKLLELLRDLRSGAFFGKTVYLVYVIETQMRGLPHAHIVFKIEGDGPVQAHEIDSVISAVIPSAEIAGGRLRRLVLQHMIHGPCGESHRTDYLCWDADKRICTKFYPRPDAMTTHVDHRGFVQYRRDYNNTGIIHTRSNTEIVVHDGWVVPYNPALLLKYEAHMNLELASTRRVIKYLFKYLMKGGSLQNVNVIPLHRQENEVDSYVTKRMVGASDASWRLLKFNISESEPTVECLPVHLEGKQTVFFKPGRLDEAIDHAGSRLILYFERPTCSVFDNVTYQQFYETYIIDTRHAPNTRATEYEHPDGFHVIRDRQRGEKVCRLHWISPNRGELYFLRILLMSIPCRGFEDLLSKGGPGCTTFQEVGRYLGLVDDEQEHQHALREASTFMTGPRLRSFFVLLCNMGTPAALLWEQFRDLLAEDHLERNPLDPELAYKLALLDIDRSLRRQGSCLTDHGLPFVRDDTSELDRELDTYEDNVQSEVVDEWLPKLSPDQRRVFDHIRHLATTTSNDEYASRSPQSRVLFLDGPGGYGKTQLIKVLLAEVRSRHQVAIAVASSGIAAGNMPGGTTAHSMFRLPLDLGQGTGVWSVTNGSQRAELIRSAQLIVFDEAPMAHRYIFEMLDRSLRDLMNSDEPFGGKIFLCSGDFRQCAPVVEKARTAHDVVCVSLRSSRLWNLFKVFRLTTPQRTSGSTAYSEFLLSIGNGTAVARVFGEGREAEGRVPLQGVRHVTSLEELIAEVFPTNILGDSDECAKRAILAPHNVNVAGANRRILEALDSPVQELLSVDSVNKENEDGLTVDVQLLNQATAKGVPNHVLRLKIGCICLIMRNLNIADGLVNGTKVIVTAISPRLITVRMPGSTELFAIPRITFKFSIIVGSPLEVIRRQFPLVLAYAMSGHKSQGQTIDYVGLDLRSECFTHGLLYVMLSRVRSPDNILVLVLPERVQEGVAYVKNIVYEDLLL